jgi:hypothetical protein
VRLLTAFICRRCSHHQYSFQGALGVSWPKTGPEPMLRPYFSRPYIITERSGTLGHRNSSTVCRSTHVQLTLRPASSVCSMFIFCCSSCLTVMSTPPDVTNCDFTTLPCGSVTCGLLTNRNGLYGAAVQLLDNNVAQALNSSCLTDACFTGGEHLRSSIDHLLKLVNIKFPACTNCPTTISGTLPVCISTSVNNANVIQ